MVMSVIEDLENRNYDPFAAESTAFGDLVDIHGRLKEIRREGTVRRGHFMSLLGLDWPTPWDTEVFTVLGYEQVARVLSEFRTFSNFPFEKTLGMTFGRTLSAMDPPEHSQYRRIFQQAFLPQNVARWGDTIVGPVVSDLIDEFVDRGEADLIDEFTKHYPFQIIYRQLDLPPGDGPIFHRLAVTQNLCYTEEGREAAHKLGNYFRGLVEQRRANPGDDLASVLITTQVDGEYLPDDVTISFLRQLINAAGDTTFRGTSVLLTGLLQNPDQLEALRNDRSLMRQAIDEALRWESPVAWTERGALEDTQIDGVAIPGGSILVPVLLSANYDEKHFAEPERFNIFRERKANPIIFALGPHVCLGQHLARLEITRAMTAILDRLPNLRLDPTKPAPVIRGAMLRHPDHLHVKFG